MGCKEIFFNQAILTKITQIWNLRYNWRLCRWEMLWIAHPVEASAIVWLTHVTAIFQMYFIFYFRYQAYISLYTLCYIRNTWDSAHSCFLRLCKMLTFFLCENLGKRWLLSTFFFISTMRESIFNRSTVQSKKCSWIKQFD